MEYEVPGSILSITWFTTGFRRSQMDKIIMFLKVIIYIVIMLI